MKGKVNIVTRVILSFTIIGFLFLSNSTSVKADYEFDPNANDHWDVTEALNTVWLNTAQNTLSKRDKKHTKEVDILYMRNGNYSQNAVAAFLDFGWGTNYYNELKSNGLIPDDYQLPVISYSITRVKGIYCGNRSINNISTDCEMLQKMLANDQATYEEKGLPYPDIVPFLYVERNYTPKYKLDVPKANEALKNATTVYNGVDYANEYNAAYYYNTYPDLQKAFGYDSQKLLEHYVTIGKSEGRKAKA